MAALEQVCGSGRYSRDDHVVVGAVHLPAGVGRGDGQGPRHVDEVHQHCQVRDSDHDAVLGSHPAVPCSNPWKDRQRRLAEAQLAQPLSRHQGGSPASLGSDPAPCTQLKVSLWISIPEQKSVRAEFGVQLGKEEMIHNWRHHSCFHGHRISLYPKF